MYLGLQVGQEKLSAWSIAVAIACLLLLSGCRTAWEQAVSPVYQSAELRPGVTVVRDIPYLVGPNAHPEKHRLDLYLPQGGFDETQASIPVLVFAHGGSLYKGDKDLEVVGLDFYRNIGRFYSARGVAVGIVNYRLQPEVTWREQVADVAAAASWVQSHISDRILGGVVEGASGERTDIHRKARLYLAGHSAGAWLVSRVALDREVRQEFGLDNAIAGVVSISGSGFEMTDRRTWELYPKEEWWAERFAVPAPADWHEEASVVPLVAACGCVRDVPTSDQDLRFLLLYSNHESLALARQNRLLSSALDDKGLENRLVAVSSGSHRRTVMAMSHPQKILSREILSFLTTNRLDLAPNRQNRIVKELAGSNQLE